MPTPGDAIFGTDGIRGCWGTPPLDPDSIVRLGSALSSVLGPCRLLIGEDPRESSPWIRDHLLKGMSSKQQVGICGVIPTPGLSWAVRTKDWDWGIMITASHNPWKDNGIKLFARDGSKADDHMEARITAAFHAEKGVSGGGARSRTFATAGDYATALRTWGDGLAGGGTRLVVDAANGAAAGIAASLFADLGYAVDIRCAAPDGRNINEACGATHLAPLQSVVKQTGAALGIALDGDGDRVLFVAPDGSVITGDHVLFALAGGLGIGPAVRPTGVVGTVMSNMGLELELSRRGIPFRRADVGDRHVAKIMRETGFVLGGEPSGHTIYSPIQPTGDGLLTALLLLRVLKEDPAAMALRLGRDMEWFAQETRSIQVKRRRDLEAWPELQSLRKDIEARHRDRVRLLIRYSGTEPKLRVMVEAEAEELIRPILAALEAVIRRDDPGTG